MLEEVASYNALSGNNKSGKIFVGEKFSHFWRISYFSPTNFSSSSLFPDLLLRLKVLSRMGLLFFQRKVVLLIWNFPNWARRNALLVSLIHRIGCCKYTHSWISETKSFCTSKFSATIKFSEEYLRNFNHTFLYYRIIIIHFTIMKWYNI